MMDWIIGALFVFLGALMVGLVVLAITAGGPPDPCVETHAKTSDTYFHGWHAYGDRQVWCGPGERP